MVRQEPYAAPDSGQGGRHQLGGISPTTFYALVNEGELSLVKIGRRSFVHAEDLEDFLRRKRYVPGGEGKGIGAERS
ncbi:MAG: helix-turn-helix domain-containing protein [Mycobacterium sp.]